MGSDVLTEILEWSTTQPAWQRDALRRLFTAGSLSEQDIDQLVALCKAGHGLEDPKAARPLEQKHLAITEADARPVTLRYVTHHKGVNALAPDQTVTFGPRLTVVYGQNAAGKSGYTRILKRACRSRFTEAILGNVLQDAPLKGQATIGYEDGDGEHKADWSPDGAPTGPLASVSVFDGQCAPVYLRDKTDVAFRPFSLDVFDQLSGGCSAVKDQLEREQLPLYAPTPDLPQVDPGTKVATLLANLTARTKPEDVRTLATLSMKEDSRLKALRAQKRDLLAADPKKKAQELDLKAGRLTALAEHLAGILSALDDAAVTALRSAATELATARKALARLSKTVITPDLLPGTGEEAWRTVWEAAEAFSAAAYPDRPFPVTSADGKCLFCQQGLHADAVTRFAHFVELVSSTAQADVRTAEAAHAQLLALVRELETDGQEQTIVELEDEHEELAKRVQTFIAGAENVQARILKGDVPVKGLQGDPEPDVRAQATTLRERASLLRKQTPQMDPKEATELKELEARSALKEHLDAVLSEIERKSKLSAYFQCVEETVTTQITRKSTELTKRLVTEKLRDGFQEELKQLKFSHLAIEIKAAGGAKGALFHRLVFSNAPKADVHGVLSEGESRTLSLAAFLAELSTASRASGIIFDDPVSSLDHIWRERIATRLVSFAKNRQVVVFTHDILFLRRLADEAEKQQVPIVHQHVRREGSAGYVSTELPWGAMPIKKRIAAIKDKSQTATAVFKKQGMEHFEPLARQIYSSLR